MHSISTARNIHTTHVQVYDHHDSSFYSQPFPFSSQGSCQQRLALNKVAGGLIIFGFWFQCEMGDWDWLSVQAVKTLHPPQTTDLLLPYLQLYKATSAVCCFKTTIFFDTQCEVLCCTGYYCCQISTLKAWASIEKHYPIMADSREIYSTHKRERNSWFYQM